MTLHELRAKFRTGIQNGHLVIGNGIIGSGEIIRAIDGLLNGRQLVFRDLYNASVREKQIMNSDSARWVLVSGAYLYLIGEEITIQKTGE